MNVMQGLGSGGCHPVFSFKAFTQLLNLSLLFMADLMCHVEENDAPITVDIARKTLYNYIYESSHGNIASTPLTF